MKFDSLVTILDIPRLICEFLSLFDWITPTGAFIEDVAEGGPLNLDAWTFYIPNTKAIHKGWSEAHIEELLTQNGIKTWGGLVHFGEFSFSVKLEQAAWAEYILNKHGVPILPKSQGAPSPRKERKSVVSAFFEIFEGAK